MLTVLVAGASGATGRLLGQQLLDRGHRVRVIVRSTATLPDNFKHHADLTVIRAAAQCDLQPRRHEPNRLS